MQTNNSLAAMAPQILNASIVVDTIAETLSSDVATSEHLSPIDYKLTGVKIDKVGIFFPYYGERTDEFVFKCSGRGDNSWKKVAQRIHDLETADERQNAYVNRIYEELELDVVFAPLTIIKTIGTIRRELKMPIGEQNTKWYIEQVCSLYLVEKVLDESVGYSKVIGYRFLFRLKP